MQKRSTKWILAATLLPIVVAFALQYESGRTSGTIYVDQVERHPVTFIINTTDPQKVRATFALASTLYNKGIQTTILLEGAGVTLVHSSYADEEKYEGEIIACPVCLKAHGIQPHELPDTISSAMLDSFTGIHADQSNQMAEQ